MNNVNLRGEATAVEQFAADQLTHYVTKLWPEGCPYNFVLGRADDLAGPEGMRIRITEDTVTLEGSPDNEGRGLLYAVYEFLERYTGCSFAAYSDPEVAAGEYIPTEVALPLPTGKYEKQSADLPYRTAIVQFHFWVGNADRGLTVPFIDWLAKNRFNRILTWVGCYEQMKELGMLPELAKRGIRLAVGHHQAISTWLPPYGNAHFSTAYAQEHPDFYRLMPDGSRYLPKGPEDYNGQWFLCSHNPACVQTVANNILQWLEQNPLVDTIAFWPHDGSEGQCCCPDCAPYSKMENYLYFENELARLVTAQRPDVKIDVLVYQDLWTCPEGITLCDGIRIDMATWAKAGLRPCGKPDGSALVGSVFDENLLSFRKHCNHTVYYDYYMGNFGNRQKVMPAADEMQNIFRHMAEVGIEGSGTQMECFNHWNNLCNFYCFARTAYDTDLSLEDHLARLTVLFGEGGETVKEILRLYEETLDGQVPIDKTGSFFIEQIDTERVYALFDAALEQTTRADCRNNIRLLRMAFRYSHLSTLAAPNNHSVDCKVCDDPTGELAYMATHFDSYYSNYTGLGIAIPLKMHTGAPAPDHWYILDK